MDNQNNILESITVNRTYNIQPASQSEINDLAFETAPSQLINLKDPATSWVSYILSPVKSTMQVANEFGILVTNNPKLAFVVGMSYMIPAVEAACMCWCSRPRGSSVSYCSSLNGTRIDTLACAADCGSANCSYSKCTTLGD